MGTACKDKIITKTEDFKMNRGIVKWFHNQKGYGFITMEDGTEVFVHYSDIVSEKKFKFLEEGQTVEFEIVDVEKGKQAVNVIVIEAECNIDIDPREEIVSKIATDFGVEIPLMSWSGMELAELEAYYEELKTK